MFLSQENKSFTMDGQMCLTNKKKVTDTAVSESF